MATPVTSTTFLSNYNDDYTDSDHYHRILFNNGRSLQARELTQSQTIIQKELARLAGFVFNEGGMFSTSPGSILAGRDAINFVKVGTLPIGYAALVGSIITNTAGVKAIVKAVIPAAGSDPNTLFVVYTTSNSLLSEQPDVGPRIFQAGEVLSHNAPGLDAGTISIQSVNTSSNPATGKGAFVEVPQFNTFAAGHLILVEKQSLVLSKYSSSPTTVVGFKLTQQVITTSDDIALFDNSGSTPNLTSPGADRFKITMTLIEESNVPAGDTFYSVFDIKSGVARNIKNQDNLLGELGSILSSRTQDITGNFVVHGTPFGKFGIEVADDSADTHLLYKISGGVGFVSGNRIERSTGTTIRVAKARDLNNDREAVTNEFIAASYGNFFLADSAHGLINGIDTLSTVNLYSANQRAGSNLGTARIRMVDEFDNQYRIHVFDVALTGTNSLNQVRSIGTSAANYANIASLDARFDIHDRANSSLLFPLNRKRADTVENVTMAVSRIYSATSNGSGQATFSTGSSNIFSDQENWIVNVTSTGALTSPPTVSGTPNTATTITGLANNAPVKLLGFENIAAVRKTKTLQAETTQAGLSLTSRKFTLNKADIYKINSIVDDTTNEDVTYRYIVDNGQRDDFYTVGGGRLKNGMGSPAGTITVKYTWFAHSSGDYFGGTGSYPDVSYRDIPMHTTKAGKTYRLSDVIDMRPIKNSSGADFTSSGAVRENIPRNGQIITIGDVKYWQRRIDTLTLSPDGLVRHYKGVPSFKPEPSASIPPGEMRLHAIGLEAYTTDKRDTLTIPYENRGYKMSDIESLENRIENLEEFVTLTKVDIDNLKTTIPDPNDATLPDRVKLGLTADAFATNMNSNVHDQDYRAFLAKTFKTMQPFGFKRQLPLHYDSDLSTNTIIKGSSIWPKYTEEVMLQQNTASEAINVNQFEMTKSLGSGYLEPNTDTWQVRKKVDEAYQVSSTESFIPIGSVSTSSQGDNRG